LACKKIGYLSHSIGSGLGPGAHLFGKSVHQTLSLVGFDDLLGYAHRFADLEPPTNSEHVRATLRGIRRTVGAASARKAPVLAEQARAMAFSAPEGLKGLRDCALLLLLGFAGAFRRSELVALDVADLEETEDGFKIIIRRSKTDQEGHGATIARAG
jgi:integrase